METNNAEAALQDAVSDVVIAASAIEANAHETADEAFERGLEAAESTIDEQQKIIERQAEAAMQSHLGREMEALKREYAEWRDGVDRRLIEAEAMKSELAELKGQIAATALLAVSPTASSLSTPPNSETVQEAVTEVAELLPETLQSGAAESPAPEAPAKMRKGRWI